MPEAAPPFDPSASVRASGAADGGQSLLAPLTSLLSPTSAATRGLVTISPAATVEEAARRMRDRAVGSLLVSHAEPGPDGTLPRAALAGIVTDRDLRDRVLAAGRGAGILVGAIASAPVAGLAVGSTGLEALLEMAERRIRHLILFDRDRVVGVLSASDLARLQSRQPLAWLRRLERRPLVELLPVYAGEVRRAVAELAAAGLDAVHLGPLVATWNDALARRLLAQAVAELGPPPVALCWAVHGSDGRREQILPTDQDNALLWQPGPQPRPGEDERWIAGLAERMVDGLLAAGFPRCPGGYMATHWHDPLAGWEARFAGWIDHPRPETLLDLSTLLDLRPVAGDLALDRLDEQRAAAGRNRLLLRLLAQESAGLALPVGLFGRLREGKGGFDLKRGSLLIVRVARLFALEAGSRARSTLDRLRDAEAVLGPDAATLAESFRFLAGLRLAQALRAGSAPAPGTTTHHVRLVDLNALERRFLKDTFHFLKSLTAGLPLRYAL
jgi:CBS domain-containing protein